MSLFSFYCTQDERLEKSKCCLTVKPTSMLFGNSIESSGFTQVWNIIKCVENVTKGDFEIFPSTTTKKQNRHVFHRMKQELKIGEWKGVPSEATWKRHEYLSALSPCFLTFSYITAITEKYLKTSYLQKFTTADLRYATSEKITFLGRRIKSVTKS